MRRRPDSAATVRGHRVLEVLPEVGWYKGECALWIGARSCPRRASR